MIFGQSGSSPANFPRIFIAGKKYAGYPVTGLFTSVLTGNPASQWGSIAFIQQSCFYDTLCPSVGLNSEETVPLTENLIQYKMY